MCLDNWIVRVCIILRCFIVIFCGLLVSCECAYSRPKKQLPLSWDVDKISGVLEVFHNQKISDYSFKFRLTTQASGKISDGVLYFSSIDEIWKFRIECDDLRILLTKDSIAAVEIFDVKNNSFLTKNLNEALIPGHELTGNDLLTDFLRYPTTIPAYSFRTSGRDCYGIICNIGEQRSKISEYLDKLYILAKTNLECSYVLKPEYIEYDFYTKYHLLHDCVKAYFDAEFAAVLKAEFYKDKQIVHSFQLRNFKRVKNDWTVRKIEIKNYLNDCKTIFDVRYAAVNVELPREVFTIHSLSRSANVGRIIYEKCF